MKWCTHCVEGFCTDCEKSHRSLKLTRDHKVIAIEDYLKIQDVSFDLTCKIHGKKLDLFCKFHSVAICGVCVPSAHKTCQVDDIISIDDVAENAKSSAALKELEISISRTLEHVRHCIENRLSASEKIDIEEQMIKNTILQTKLKLIKHLDALEEKILLKLRRKIENYMLKYSKFLKKLEVMEKEFEKLEEQTQQMKLFASDLQVFLGTCQMNNITMGKIKTLKAEIGREQNYTIEMKLNSMVSSLMNKVKHFGEIHIIESNADLQLKDAMIDQAQIQVRWSVRNIHDINLQLKMKFDLQPQSLVTGCFIMSNGRILIADFSRSGKLIEYDDTGKSVVILQTSSKPYDLTEIDTDRIAVTYPFANLIEILNIQKNTIEKKIGCKQSCFGISYHNGRLFTVVKERGIVILDTHGTRLQTIKIDTMYVCVITATEDKLYYTVQDQQTVNCCNFEGEIIWIFKNESLNLMAGLTVDNNQNVYVLSHGSYNLTLIQHDGKQSKEVLNVSDDLSSPTAVCYNKNRNLILLCYTSNKVALYQVS
ncbi:uncharacterized protein [Mytilus edulis]|uniref:uncharacterized protein n=1 Tax=Mytilus edulis TaxID=6550 RepID=UPI0039EF445B